MSQANSSANSRLAAWYVSRGGETSGPFATDMVSSMLRDGRLQPLDLVYREGELEWKPASVFAELKSGRAVASESPSPDANVTVKSNAIASQRSAVSWIVLRPHRGTYLQEGPFETQAIIDGLQTGSFQFSQYAWHVGMSQWMRIGDLREFDRRSRSREARPHVPPPLPDPIAAVLLEDDKDLEAEEFHVSMKGVAKLDQTPNPLEGLSGFNTTFSGTVGMGGAAAESPEEKRAQAKAGQAMALVVSPNLAGVPWEQDFTERYAASVGIIDDEHSGIDLSSRFQSSDLVTNPGIITSPSGSLSPPAPVVSSVASASTGADLPTGEIFPTESSLEKTPHPFLPPASLAVGKDAWALWGRHVAGGVMAVVAVVFVVHLVTFESMPTESAPKISSAVPPRADVVAKPVAVAKPKIASKPLADPFGSMDDPGAVGVRPNTSVSSTLSVAGIKLEKPDGQIVIQGQIPPGVPVEVSFKGRLGQVLGKMNVRKTVEIKPRSGEIPSIALKDLKLPDGAYTVEVNAGGSRAKSEVFVGRRDARFLDRLETHLREVSIETQSQKKALFYAAQELDSLARDLGQNYGQLRSRPEMWSAFYSKWTQKVSSVGRAISGLEKKKVDDRAYPEETAALGQAYSNLQKLAAQYKEAIGQKRDLASDELTELIAELSRQKASIGDATARPTADTPDGLL